MRKNNHFRKISLQILVRNILPVFLTFFLSFFAVFYLSLPAFKASILESKKLLIKEVSYISTDLLREFQDQVAHGQISLEDAQKKALRQIKLIRYGEGHKDYFWIVNDKGVVLLHPYRPDLEGSNLLNYTDPAGKYFIKEIVDVANKHGEGYVKYLWQWQDHPNKVIPKIAYIKKFEPWGWIIGVGFYANDINTETNIYLKDLTWIFMRILGIIALLSLYLIWQFTSQELKRIEFEEKLTANEQRYRSLVENMNDGICVIDANRRIQYVNPKFCDFLGFTTDEIMGKPIFDFLTPQGFELFMKHLSVIRHQASTSYELELYRKDRSIFFGLISPQLIFDEKGNWKGGFAVVSDINARKKWEQELSFTEQRFRNLFNTMKEGVAVYRPTEDGHDFIFVDINNAGCAIPSMIREDVIGKKLSEVFPSAKHMGLINLLQQVNMSGNTEHLGTTEYKDNRISLWVENYAFKLSTGEIVAVYDDKTETKRVEFSLLESEKKYRELVENANSIILKTDVHGRITFANEFALKFFGYSSEELIGENPVNKIIPVHDSIGRNLKDFVDELLSAPEKFVNHENENVRKNGERVWVNWTNKPIYDSDNKLTGVLSIGMDITKRKKAEEALLKEQNFTSSILDNSPVFFVAVDLNHKVLLMNNAMLSALGYKKEEASSLHYVNDLVPEHERDLLRARFGDLISTKRQLSGMSHVLTKGGQEILVEWRGSTILNGEGDVDFIIGVGIDITEQQKVKDLSIKLNQVVEQNPATVIITDLSGHIEYVNRQFTDITGYTSNEVIGKSPRFLQSGYTSQTDYQDLWNTILLGHNWSGELCNRRKNGEVYWAYVSISPIKNAKDLITHFVAIEEDITLRKEYENRLEYQANYDGLTNLPNRVLALDRLTQAVARAQRENKSVAVLLVGLDRFKEINDTLGHTYGDHLLQHVSQRLKETVRESDTVARMAGDEFLIILSDLESTTHSDVVAKKILVMLSMAFVIEGKELFTSASIGITIAPSDGRDAQILFKNAEAAMFKAKENSRNTSYYFTPAMNEKMSERMELESHLRHALENKEFFLHYQPLLSLQTGKIIGFEALIRWQNRVLGLVMPDKFIALCEENGLIVPIGEWVLREACSQAKYWNDQLGLSLKVAVNISVRQFRHGDLSLAVKSALERAQLSPDKLELEITEHLLMDCGEHIMECIQKISGMGVHFAIDDFGTGYSSLNYLQKFPVDMVKIDRSFIKEMPGNTNTNALIKGIISLSKSLNLKVTSEGVETKEQAGMLQEYGCDFVQGFYFSKPVSPADFLDYVKNFRNQT
ncbi:MAG: PAS domain S-box protein [Candidatus Omnitrophica bacterium]|nr:PAS domain S-box protein [Candidatus Omnitrophota bacterium]